MKNIHHVVELTGQICSMTLSLEYMTPAAQFFGYFNRATGCGHPVLLRTKHECGALYFLQLGALCTVSAQKEIQFPFVPEIIEKQRLADICLRCNLAHGAVLVAVLRE